MSQAAGLTLLMCPPTFFGVEYEINPWMSLANQPDWDLAQDQWWRLYANYLRLGCRVKLVQPRRGLPDMVFTANAAVVIGGKAAPSNFRPPPRQGERPYLRAWFVENDYQVLDLPPEALFEGSGKPSCYQGKCLLDYGIRSDRAGVETVGRMAGMEVLPLEVVDPRFYHLDMCFTPLDERRALYYPPAFSPESRRVLEATVPELVEISQHDAWHFGCNMVAVGRTAVINSGCRELPAQLRQMGFQVVELEMSEFHKAGGGVRCLTLEV